MSAPAQVNVPVLDTLLLDESKTIAFLRQCAQARLVNHATTVTWKTDKSSGTMNTLYGLKYILTAGNSAQPGFMEVKGISNGELRSLAAKHNQALLKAYATNLKQGPHVLIPWLTRQQQLFERDIKEYKQTMLEAKKVNQMVDDELQRALFNLATVKFASECMLQCLGITPFGAMAGVVTRLAIGVGYPMLCAFVNDWNSAAKAKVVYSVGAAGGSATVQSLPSLLSEDALIKACEFFFVDKKFGEAKQLLAEAGSKALKKQLRDQGLRGAALGAARKEAAKNLVAKANSVKAGAEMNRLGLAGLKVVGPALQGVSCWFAVQGAQQSANDYWQTLEEAGFDGPPH